VSRETTFTADDVAAAFRAGLELGRRGELTPDSTTAPDDGGFAERFLEDRRRAPVDGFAALRLVTEDQVNEVLDGAPAPTGLDPETIAAARRIARRLNGRPR
jgi:hypothetical protein